MGIVPDDVSKDDYTCLYNQLSFTYCRNFLATTTILHEPRLDTILMVEREIQKARSYPTKKELWQSLPRKLQYQTFNRILDYLESSNKIVLDEGQIVWTFPSSPKLRKLLRNSVRVR